MNRYDPNWNESVQDMQNTTHLVALTESMSRKRQYLAEARTENERKIRQHNIMMHQREIDAELRFLGMPLDSELPQMSEDELLSELLG